MKDKKDLFSLTPSLIQTIPKPPPIFEEVEDVVEVKKKKKKKVVNKNLKEIVMYGVILPPINNENNEDNIRAWRAFAEEIATLNVPMENIYHQIAERIEKFEETTPYNVVRNVIDNNRGINDIVFRDAPPINHGNYKWPKWMLDLEKQTGIEILTYKQAHEVLNGF